MSEELYNSSDYCSLAEQYEELKKENAELSKDKDRLMNLFMESSEYVFDTSANMKIESLTRKCKALEADYAVSNREMLLMQVEIGELKSELARKDEQIEKLEDALHKISNWCKAYPLEIADEPTEDEWKTAHAIMNQRGWSLTTFVVSGMRRVTNGIAEIADLGG